jgi:hypothetical protein
VPSGPPYRSGIERVADNFESIGFRWVPLVRRKHNWACSLTLSLLVRQPPYGPFNGQGDLDNRVKTLIDGLSKPRQKCDLPDGAKPDADEDPFFVLLEDDSLIFDFSVSIDRLLRPPLADEDFSDVEATIRAKVMTADGEPPFAVTVA